MFSNSDEEEEGGDLDKLLASKVLKDSFANKLIEKARKKMRIRSQHGNERSAWDGEIRHLLKAIKILLQEKIANLDNPGKSTSTP